MRLLKVQTINSKHVHQIDFLLYDLDKRTFQCKDERATSVIKRNVAIVYITFKQSYVFVSGLQGQKVNVLMKFILFHCV